MSAKRRHKEQESELEEVKPPPSWPPSPRMEKPPYGGTPGGVAGVGGARGGGEMCVATHVTMPILSTLKTLTLNSSVATRATRASEMLAPSLRVGMKVKGEGAGEGRRGGRSWLERRGATGGEVGRDAATSESDGHVGKVLVVWWLPSPLPAPPPATPTNTLTLTLTWP